MLKDSKIVPRIAQPFIKARNILNPKLWKYLPSASTLLLNLH